MSLFKCEDDRYELDMLIELTAGAIRSLSTLLESLPDGSDAQEDPDQSVYVSKINPQHIKVCGCLLCVRVRMHVCRKKKLSREMLRLDPQHIKVCGCVCVCAYICMLP